MVHQSFRFTAGPGITTPVVLPAIVDSNGNPTGCQRVMIRPNTALPVDYDVLTPLSTSPTFRRIAGEAHVFGNISIDPRLPQQFGSGQTIGYVKPPIATIDFSGLCEG